MPFSAAKASSSALRLPVRPAKQFVSRRVIARAFKARIIVFTGPIEAGAIDSVRNPRPISAMASSGRPAISPQSVSGTLSCLAQLVASCLSALSGATESESNRFATRAFERSAANRNCSRSLLPTDTKSTLFSRARRARTARSAPRSWPRSAACSAARYPASWRVRSRCRSARWISSISPAIDTIGIMIRSSRPAAARRSARTCMRNSAGRSSDMRIARQPMAGFSSGT